MHYLVGILICVSSLLIGTYIGARPDVMEILNDTLKEDGKWSKSAIMIIVTFLSNIIYAGWCIYQTAVFVDLPTNWMGFMLALYTINKTATTVIKKAEINATTP